jgi:hypothetical protein
MSESRSEFEAWAKLGSDFPEVVFADERGKYPTDHHQMQWEAWQASRRAALEEAIGTLDQFEPSMSEDGSSYYLRQIEMAIRAIASKD